MSLQEPAPVALSRRALEDFRGRCEIRPTDPPFEEWRDVYATPHVEEGCWGLFDRHDAPVAIAVEQGGDPLAPLRQVPESPTRHALVSETAPPGDYVYGGRQVYHFGHFLIETLARLWPWRDGLPPGATLVMQGDGTPDRWFAIPYVRAILGALGIGPARILHVDRPMRFDRLRVPGAAFLPGAAAHPAFVQLTRRIGERLVGPLTIAARDPRPAFFAKTRLIGGVSHLHNEAALIEALARRGVAIVHPQEMSFAEHIRFMASRRVISGWVSSAHHVSLFAPPGGRFAMLAPQHPNSNFALIDALTGSRADYWFAEGTHNVQGRTSTFIVERVLPDPEAVALALLEKL